MRKLNILIISYNYPPLKRAGSIRVAGWISHLPENISATIITRNWAQDQIYNRENYFQEDDKVKEEEQFKQHTIVRVPNKFNFYFRIKNNPLLKKTSLNKIFTFFELLFKWRAFFYIQNERSLFNESKKQLENNSFDLILASGEPFITFYYAYKLSKIYRVPYALDYRDPWNKNFFKKSFIDKIILLTQKPIEIKAANEASLIITVSEKNKSIINDVINQGAKVNIISNGISETIFQDRDKKKDPFFNDSFTITFLGTLYEKHNLINFLNALSEIIEEKLIPQIRICFIGTLETLPTNKKAVLEKFETKHPDRIKFISQLDQNDAWKYLDISKVLLKFNAFPQEENHFGLKLYEYAAIGKPVLSINSKASFPKKSCFFEDKPFQFFCFSVSDIKESLKHIYLTKILDNKINKLELVPYTISYQTKKLAKLLTEIK